MGRGGGGMSLRILSLERWDGGCLRISSSERWDGGWGGEGEQIYGFHLLKDGMGGGGWGVYGFPPPESCQVKTLVAFILPE